MRIQFRTDAEAIEDEDDDNKLCVFAHNLEFYVNGRWEDFNVDASVSWAINEMAIRADSDAIEKLLGDYHLVGTITTDQPADPENWVKFIRHTDDFWQLDITCDNAMDVYTCDESLEVLGFDQGDLTECFWAQVKIVTEAQAKEWHLQGKVEVNNGIGAFPADTGIVNEVTESREVTIPDGSDCVLDGTSCWITVTRQGSKDKRSVHIHCDEQGHIHIGLYKYRRETEDPLEEIFN